MASSKYKDLRALPSRTIKNFILADDHNTSIYSVNMEVKIGTKISTIKSNQWCRDNTQYFHILNKKRQKTHYPNFKTRLKSKYVKHRYGCNTRDRYKLWAVLKLQFPGSTTTPRSTRSSKTLS
ncbi:unnamed protein product, partial [Nesidiocoris tenuis]